jgi:hypothetical protein
VSVDRRESILQLLVVIARSIEGIRNVYRNKTDISALQRPAIVIYDADESADERAFSRGRPTRSPNIIGLTPEIHLMAGRDSEAVGSDLNAMRMAFIKAVLNDADLGLILGNNGVAEYMGCSTDLGQGRTAEGNMAVMFQFNYPLLPDEL